MIIGGYGGIGRRARFRFWWETVQVQVLLTAVGFEIEYCCGGICLAERTFEMFRRQVQEERLALYYS